MTNNEILKKEMQNKNAVSILYEDNGQHGTLKSAKNIVLDAMDAAREDEAGKMPTVDEAGVIAARISEHLTAQEQALFIAGFQECIKYIKHKNEKLWH